MMKKAFVFALTLAVSFLLTACSAAQAAEPQKPNPDVGVHFSNEQYEEKAGFTA